MTPACPTYTRFASVCQSVVGHTGCMHIQLHKVKPDDPAFLASTLSDVDGYRTSMVPLVVHRDGVSFTRKNKLLVLSMSFLFGTGWSWECIFILACFPVVNRIYSAAHNNDGDTWGDIWEYLLSGFESFFYGVHAPVDPYGNIWPIGSSAAALAGKPVCDGLYKAIVWVLAHDAEYGCNELKWPHYNAVRCCGWCVADRSGKKFRDVRPNAAWIATLYKYDVNDRVSSHAVWRISGVSRFSHRGDTMHGLILGPVICLHASLIWTLLDSRYGLFRTGTLASRLADVWALIQQCYKATKTQKRLTTLTLGMIGTNYLPALSCGAAEARHLVPAMVCLLQTCHRGIDHDDHCLQAYLHLETCLSTMSAGGLVLSDTESELCLYSMEHFLLHYNWLTKWSRSLGEYLCNSPTKNHACWHIAFLSKWLNPTASWCYAFEDFIGRIKLCGHAQTPGTTMEVIPAKIFQNYRLILTEILGVDVISR